MFEVINKIKEGNLNITEISTKLIEMCIDEAQDDKPMTTDTDALLKCYLKKFKEELRDRQIKEYLKKKLIIKTKKGGGDYCNSIYHEIILELDGEIISSCYIE